MLEADVSTFSLARGIWEDATDAWNGIIICYDVTDPKSLLHVEELLRKVIFAVPTVRIYDHLSQEPSGPSMHLALCSHASPN